MIRSRPVSLDRDQVFEKVRSHLAEELGVDAGSISDSTHFRDDLEADSLALVEIVEIVEEALAPRARPGFHLEDDDLDALTTVGDAVDLVVRNA